MFTEEQKRSYLQLMEDTELPKRAIAARLGISYNTFLQYEARWGVQVKRRVFDADGQPVTREPETVNA